MGRKIAIVGAGAVGGYAGAHMVQAGEDVTFIDPWPEHVEHMRKHGLRVTHAMDVAEFSVPVRALHVTTLTCCSVRKVPRGSGAVATTTVPVEGCSAAATGSGRFK